MGWVEPRQKRWDNRNEWNESSESYRVPHTTLGCDIYFAMFISLKFCWHVRNDHTKVAAPHPQIAISHHLLQHLSDPSQKIPRLKHTQNSTHNTQNPWIIRNERMDTAHARYLKRYSPSSNRQIAPLTENNNETGSWRSCCCCCCSALLLLSLRYVAS